MGAYRAKTVLRVFIPKVDGSKRLIGVMVVTYKQGVVAEPASKKKQTK